MEPIDADVRRLQLDYTRAVDAWIAAIRKEEARVSANSSVEEIDRWEAAHFAEEDARKKAKAAKEQYESALRAKFFGI